MFIHHHYADSSLMLGRAVTATRVQQAASQTKGTRSEGARDVDAWRGAAADEFPPGYAEFVTARAQGIAIARNLVQHEVRT